MALASALNMSGTDASKPSSGFVAGRIYIATDTHKLYVDSGSAWVDSGLGAGGGGGAATVTEALLGADVALSVVGTTYDGPTLSCVAGSYVLIGQASLYDTSAGHINVSLWDGTTTYSTGEAINGGAQMVTLVAMKVLGSTTTVKLSANAAIGSGGTLYHTTPHEGLINCTRITAIKYA